MRRHQRRRLFRTAQDDFRQQHIENENKVVGVFEATGVRPGFYEAFLANGIEVPDIFNMNA